MFCQVSRISLIKYLIFFYLFLVCGYNVTENRLEQINKFLDDKSSVKVDLPMLLQALTYLKELELQNEQEIEADEYLDAFVALGGSQN
jgi:hypothetical protein